MQNSPPPHKHNLKSIKSQYFYNKTLKAGSRLIFGEYLLLRVRGAYLPFKPWMKDEFLHLSLQIMCP